jgi:hypothetical protein
MEVRQLTTTIDSSGNLRIDIPTRLDPGEVNVVLVVSAIAPSISRKPNYDFSDLAGKLSWRGDAVAMQRKLQDEGWALFAEE